MESKKIMTAKSGCRMEWIKWMEWVDARGCNRMWDARARLRKQCPPHVTTCVSRTTPHNDRPHGGAACVQDHAPHGGHMAESNVGRQRTPHRLIKECPPHWTSSVSSSGLFHPNFHPWLKPPKEACSCKGSNKKDIWNFKHKMEKVFCDAPAVDCDRYIVSLGAHPAVA